MLMHHNGQDYNVAASAAATDARKRFDAEIERGKTRALAVIEQVNRDVPQDRVVVGKKLTFHADANGVKVEFPDHDHTVQGFHRHAIGQAATRAEIPLAYIDKLMTKGAWGHELVAENLNTLYHNSNGAKYLARSVQGEVRGFLSDSYRRLDSRPILDAFIGGVRKFGAVPVDGYALDTKVAVKVVLPMVFEPVDNEVMIFGAAFENSDFGNGAISVRTFVERLWCTNRAISNEDLRKIHIGGRLSEDLQLSQRTYDLDTQTMASAVQDITQHTLSAGNVNRFLEAIKVANEQKIKIRSMKDFLAKNLNKTEAGAVIEAFNSPDIEMLPAGNTAWRMSNAISWIANTKIEDEERKLEVMKVAGALLNPEALAQAA
jgi:hypothetical protein